MRAFPTTPSSACAKRSRRRESLPGSSSSRECRTPSTRTIARRTATKPRKRAGGSCSTGSGATASARFPGPRAVLADVLERRSLSTLFQPIFSFGESRLLGYEALVRGPEGSLVETPYELFGAAQREGRVIELNIVCIQEVLRAFAQRALPGTLFLNISPQLIVQKGFDLRRAARFLADLGLRPE